MSPMCVGETSDSRNATHVVREMHGFRVLNGVDQSSTADFMNANEVIVRMSVSSKSDARSLRMIGSRRFFACDVRSHIHSSLHGSHTTSRVTSTRVDG